MERPACKVKLVPAFVMLMALLTVISVFACKITLATIALILVAVMTVVTPVVFKNWLFTPPA